MPVLAVVGAHALDAELMGGEVSLLMSKSGWEVYMVHMTRGERGNPFKEPEEYGRQLETEMDNCAAKLNAKCKWMGYKAGAIPQDEITVMDLCRLFREIKADAILTHWKGSYHPRHVQTHEQVTKAALVMSDKSFLPEIETHGPANLWFGENMEDQEGFSPEFYLDTTEVHSAWWNALKEYQLFNEGMTGFPYQNFYMANSKLRGIEVGVEHAKALMHQKALIKDVSINGLEARLPKY